MKLVSCAIAAALLGASLAFSVMAPLVAQTPTNASVKIEYVEPRSAALKGVYERARKYRVLELLQEFLAPLRLPKQLQVRAAECGAQNSDYSPGQPVTICYEAMVEIERNAPTGKIIRIGPNLLSKDGAIVGGFVNLVLNQTTLAVLDMLEVPIWGRREDAADFVTALVMLEFHKNPVIIWATLAGTSWFLSQRGFVGQGDFTDVMRASEVQRFYNYACLAVGARPDLFGFLVTNKDVPERRARGCRTEYNKVKRAFVQTIMPNIDAATLKQVRELDWANRLNLVTKP